MSNVADEQIGQKSHHHGEGSEWEELPFALVVDFAVGVVAVVVVVRVLDGWGKMNQWFAAQQSQD